MGRRTNGEGSVYQRESDGRWCASISLGLDKNGRKVRKTLYGKTRREVVRKLQEAQQAKSRGVHVLSDRQLAREFFTYWLEKIIRPRARPATYNTYGAFMRTHIIPALGDIPLAKLQPQHILNLFNRQTEQGLAVTSVYYTYVVLRMALKQAVEWELIQRNVAEKVTPPRGESAERPLLTAHQIRTLLTASRDTPDGTIYLVALMLGLRQGEILGLRWRDVDMEGRRLSVRHSLQDVHGGVPVFAEPKTKSSRRTLPIPDALLQVLKQHKQDQVAQRRARGPEWIEYDLVFPNARGGGLRKEEVRLRFNDVLKANGLPSVHFHDLRHACATLLAMEGVPARVTMEILGHANIRITQEIYTHVQDGMKREALDALSKVFEGLRDAA